MSLSSDTLYREFLRWFKSGGSLTTYAQAEHRLATIYHTYAQSAEDVSGESPDNLDLTKFEGPLRFSLSRSERQTARQIEDAFVAYWTGTTFPILVVPPASPPCPNIGGTGEFSSEVSSAVSSVEADVMYDAILTLLSRGSNTAEQAARKLANAMDQATRSAVKVLITGWDTTTPTALNIINECGVF